MKGTKMSYTLKHSVSSVRNYIQLISDMATVFRVLGKKSIIFTIFKMVLAICISSVCIPSAT